MLHIAKETHHTLEEVIQAAIAFFGPGGVGLAIKEQTAGSVWFEGGGGHVIVQAQPKDAVTEVDIETREWEYPVRQFLEKI
ncbi:MAG: hypothetical protein L0332_04310 [Chloroflexi bacterium]|nr:hypothetical protein [Chloroflexota bacterium]MCI0648247.1 hypothetical protein [Chloroflexota bacterium]MCI0725933.1 hypothetical protein [Chloroflexota bacterium]